MSEVQFTYGDYQKIFGDDTRIELINGVIVIGGTPFEDVVAKYMEIKAKKLEQST